MATTIITDSLLIAKYQQGDEDALSELIRRNKKELYSFIFYKIMDEELANDLFQDTFGLFLKERRRYWCVVVVCNKCRRRRKII